MSKPATESDARLGRYDILALLGRGGMGEVYLAAHRGPSAFAKLVVVKILRAELLTDDAMLAMFEEEARVSAQLIHPNIAQTLELCVDETKPYLVMEYLDGQPLSTILKRLSKHGETMPPRILARVIVDILGALEYAHAATDLSGEPLHLVHRDVSPQNVFVTYAGQAKLLDFGIAKAVVSTENTKTGVLKGKVAFMAPEQAVGVKVDGRADLFSLGMVLLQGLTGKRPWSQTEDMQILLALAAGNVPSPAKLVTPDVPRALVDICTRALAANRDDRYSSAREMRADLESFLMSYKDAGESEDVTTLLERLFSEERAEKKALIEAKLKELMDGAFTEGALSSRRLKLRKSMLDGTSATPSPSALPSQPTPPPQTRGWGRTALLVSAAAALVAGAWFVSSHRPGTQPPVNAPASLVTADTPPAIPGATSEVHPVESPPVVAPTTTASAPSSSTKGTPGATPASSATPASGTAAAPGTAPPPRPARHVSAQTPPAVKRPAATAAPTSGSAFDLGSQE